MSIPVWVSSPMFLLGTFVPGPMLLRGGGGFCLQGGLPTEGSAYRRVFGQTSLLEPEKQVVCIILKCFLVV